MGKDKVVNPVNPDQPTQVPSYPVDQPGDDENAQERSSTRQKKYDGGDIPRNRSSAKGEK